MALELPGLRPLVVDDNSPDGTGDVAEGRPSGSTNRAAPAYRCSSAPPRMGSAGPG